MQLDVARDPFNVAPAPRHRGSRRLSSTQPLMIDRRKFLGITTGAGASLALTPELLRALQWRQQGGKLIQRAIPSTGEMLPVISFDPQEESDNAGMKEILKTLLDNGGKVIDFPDSCRRARDSKQVLLDDALVRRAPPSGPPPTRRHPEGRPRRRKSGDGGEA